MTQRGLSFLALSSSGQAMLEIVKAFDRAAEKINRALVIDEQVHPKNGGA